MPPVPGTDVPEGPPAIPPIIDPDRWEDFEGFRETFLLHFTVPEANTALRVVGLLLYDMCLEHNEHWPGLPEGFTRAELRAAVGDLRHLQGFLGNVAAEATTSETDAHQRHLCRVAGEVTAALGALADRIEKELGPRPGDKG